jgi:hypothetical protein
MRGTAALYVVAALVCGAHAFDSAADLDWCGVTYDTWATTNNTYVWRDGFEMASVALSVLGTIAALKFFGPTIRDGDDEADARGPSEPSGDSGGASVSAPPGTNGGERPGTVCTALTRLIAVAVFAASRALVIAAPLEFTFRNPYMTANAAVSALSSTLAAFSFLVVYVSVDGKARATSGSYTQVSRGDSTPPSRKRTAATVAAPRIPGSAAFMRISAQLLAGAAWLLDSFVRRGNVALSMGVVAMVGTLFVVGVQSPKCRDCETKHGYTKKMRGLWESTLVAVVAAATLVVHLTRPCHEFPVE